MVREGSSCLPRVKVDGAAALDLHSSDRYRDQGDHAQHRQAEVDVYVRKQPALGDHIVLKKLQCSQPGIAGTAAAAVNQIRVLGQSGASRGVETIGDVQEA